MSKATRLLEQAVSMVALGPVKLKNQLNRPDSMEGDIPTTAYLEPASGSFV